MPSNDKRLLLDGHAAGHVRTGGGGGGGGGWGFGNDWRKQTAEWMDGRTAGDAQHFSHSSLLFLSVCLSLLLFIYSGVEKARSFSKKINKALQKFNAVKSAR